MNTDLSITPDARKKLNRFVNKHNSEVSGLGMVESNRGQIYITDIFLLDLGGTKAGTDIDRELISDFFVDLLKKGKNPGNIRVWWHSHVDGDVHWSKADRKIVDGFNTTWMISIVGNRKGEYKTRLDTYSPRGHIDSINLRVRELPHKRKARGSDRKPGLWV